ASVSVRLPGVFDSRVRSPIARASTPTVTLESWAGAADAASASAPARKTDRAQRIIAGPSRSWTCQITAMTDAAREDEPRHIAADRLTTAGARASELRATSSLALPVVLGQIGMMFMGVVDTVMVGHVSARVLAAVALGN